MKKTTKQSTNKISYPKVSIIFPNYNGGKEPLECLASIQKLNYPQNKIEVIIVDNNSTDGSDKNIKQKYPQVNLVKMKKNLGFAKAINIGIKKSKGEYIFIGNDDITFEKNSLKIMVNYMKVNQNAGVVGGKIFQKNSPKKIVSCGYMLNTWTGNVHPAPNPNRLKNPDWIQGCAMLFNKSLSQNIGILDEDFSLLYFEDVDFCLRAKQAGFKIVYLPGAHFWHGQSTTANKNLQFKYYQWYKNKIRFTLKNLPLINIISILSFQLFIITPYRLAILHDRRFTSFLKGLLWNITHLGHTLSVRAEKKYIN